MATLRRAAAAPVHAYLFVGPPGTTKDEAARAFAALLLTGSEAAGTRDARLALAGEHPDVREIVRVGPAISAEQAAEIVRQAALSPVEGDRKVLILHEFHLLNAVGAGRLLKTIEEPPASTHFVVLADFVPVDLVTIASRCVRVEFGPIAAADLEARLLAEGTDAGQAAAAAAAAGGDLTRARLLAADPQFAERRRAFAELPRIIDGTGATVVAATNDLLARIEAAAAPVVARQAKELAELEEREQAAWAAAAAAGATIEARHKRELRRHRTDELRSGLAAIAASYRDALVNGTAPHDDTVVAAVERIHATIESFEHNPNETLMLQSLLWSLPALPQSLIPHRRLLCQTGGRSSTAADAADLLTAETELDLGLQLVLVPCVPEVGVGRRHRTGGQRQATRVDHAVVEDELQEWHRHRVAGRASSTCAGGDVGAVVGAVDPLPVPAVRELDGELQPSRCGTRRRRWGARQTRPAGPRGIFAEDAQVGRIHLDRGRVDAGTGAVVRRRLDRLDRRPAGVEE